MIICCGEALVDLFPDGDGQRAILGGSIFNTARVLARLGVPSAYVSPVSTDRHGDAIVDALNKSGVSDVFVKRVDRPTALAHVTLNNGQAEYRFEDEGSASRMVSPDELPDSVPDCELAHFGSISLVMEPCATAYEAFAVNMSATASIAIDPNIRPDFIENVPAHQERLEGLFKHTDIIKLSDEDLAWFGINADEAASRWLSGRTSIVVVTQGEAGVTGFCKSGRVDRPAPEVEVVDTVGAGDSFSAGLYAGLREHGGLHRDSLRDISLANLDKALSRGVEISAQVVQQAGAELPWPA